MDQVDSLELKNIMIEMKNLLPELNGRLEKAGVRIGGPENRAQEIIQIENQRGENGRKMNGEAEAVRHLPTLRYNGSPGKTVEREKGKKMYLQGKYS